MKSTVSWRKHTALPFCAFKNGLRCDVCNTPCLYGFPELDDSARWGLCTDWGACARKRSMTAKVKTQPASETDIAMLYLVSAQSVDLLWWYRYQVRPPTLSFLFVPLSESLRVSPWLVIMIKFLLSICSFQRSKASQSFISSSPIHSHLLTYPTSFYKSWNVVIESSALLSCLASCIYIQTSWLNISPNPGIGMKVSPHLQSSPWFSMYLNLKWADLPDVTNMLLQRGAIAEEFIHIPDHRSMQGPTSIQYPSDALVRVCRSRGGGGSRLCCCRTKAAWHRSIHDLHELRDEHRRRALEAKGHNLPLKLTQLGVEARLPPARDIIKFNIEKFLRESTKITITLYLAERFVPQFYSSNFIFLRADALGKFNEFSSWKIFWWSK